MKKMNNKDVEQAKRFILSGVRKEKEFGVIKRLHEEYDKINREIERLNLWGEALRDRWGDILIFKTKRPKQLNTKQNIGTITTNKKNNRSDEKW